MWVSSEVISNLMVWTGPTDEKRSIVFASWCSSLTGTEPQCPLRRCTITHPFPHVSPICLHVCAHPSVSSYVSHLPACLSTCLLAQRAGKAAGSMGRVRGFGAGLYVCVGMLADWAPSEKLHRGASERVGGRFLFSAQFFTDIKLRI